MALPNNHVIVTKYDPPPIAVRSADWMATLVDYDPENNDPCGFGATELEAIARLLEEVYERETSKC